MIHQTLPPLRMRGRTLLPIVQGGMGIGISAHRLAGTVAREGGVGTIASVELRRLHPDIFERTRGRRNIGSVTAGNAEALDREIRMAREIAGPDGFIAVNVMRAISRYEDLVRQACESGANAIVVGAGLPLDLPQIVEGYDDVALIPILSEPRGVRAVVKRWRRLGRVPDAVVLEHPRHAGGHLGVARIDDIDDARFDFETVLPGTLEALDSLGLDPATVPLIAAGGVNSHQRIRELFALGASAVQVGTAFAVTEEGDADYRFKNVLAGATPEQIITFMSTAGLPARAVRTTWLDRYLGRAKRLCARADPARARCPRGLECLTHCGFKDGNPDAGQFCIETRLAAAQRGDVNQGLFFRGAGALPFGHAIRPVRELLSVLLDDTARAPAMSQRVTERAEPALAAIA